jgi:hypothetical protein
MLCVRCSHPLPSRADRCLRCFALNPPGEPTALGAPPREQPTEPMMGFDLTSEPPVEVTLSIESDPPPVELEKPRSGSFRISRETPAPFLARAIPNTDPDPVELTVPNPVRIAAQPAPVAPLTVPFAKPKKPENLSLPFSAPKAPVSASVAPAVSAPSVSALLSKPFDSAPVAPAMPLSAPARIATPAPAARAAAASTAVPGARSLESGASKGLESAVRASGASRLAAWAIDASLLAWLLGLQVLLAARLSNHDFIDLALSRPLFPFWLVLLACDAIACSWLFAVAGRTPGMFAMRQRLRMPGGGLPTAGEALQRALLSLLSAAPALFGFSFALFDSRGQTLHDKLCGCIVTVD